jgi:hypothetical protein
MCCVLTILLRVFIHPSILQHNGNVSPKDYDGKKLFQCGAQRARIQGPKCNEPVRPMHGTCNIKIVLNCVCPAGLTVRLTSLKLRKHVSPKRLCLCRLIPDYVTLRRFLDDSNVNFYVSHILKCL